MSLPSGPPTTPLPFPQAPSAPGPPPSRWRWPLIVAGVLIAALVVALILPVDDDDESAAKPAGKSSATTVTTAASATTAAPTTTTTAAPRTGRVIVDATRPYVDTQLDVAAGDTVIVEATGKAFHNPSASSGPEGDPNPAVRPANVVAEANHNALIGKIGPGGRPFFVGQRLEFKADKAGRLFLGVNDTGVNNNSGAYQAQVTIKS